MLRRWTQCWEALGAARVDEGLCRDVLARYSEPHRAYHTLQHLEECLARLDESRSLAERPAEIELALWFHDAIYDVRQHDNEERSADWARASSEAAGLPVDVCERVHQLVLITRHNATPSTADEALLVDIDLSILGADPQRYDEYDAAIRQEYAWVPLPVYTFKRRAILKGFLERERIFLTPTFHDRFEQQARSNLRRSLGV
jgi:predicted metal-dependent HD superfamily phosphohydrolase